MGKGQKKKGQTLSLAEFAGDAMAQNSEVLPTAPRESDGFDDDRGGYHERRGREGDRYE